MRPTLAILLLAATVACSNPKNTKIPQDLSKLESIKPSLEKLSPEERELFSGYIMTHMMGTAPGAKGAAPIPEDMTIGQAIEEYRALVKDLRPDQVNALLRIKKDPPKK